MLFVLLKIKDQIYFAKVDNDDALISYTDLMKDQCGQIEFDKSILISGNDKIINNLKSKIEEIYYFNITDNSFNEKIYHGVINFIKELNYDIQITYGIIIDDCYEDIIDEYPTYNVYVYHIDNRSINISLDKLNIIHSKTKSFFISFENFDEAISIFEGLRYDLIELITETGDRHFTVRYLDIVRDFIETKITLLSWKNIPQLTCITGSKKYTTKVEQNNKDNFDEKEYLTASEVLKKLRISDQTLAKWRRNGQIKFKQISTRKYLYHVDIIANILDNGIGIQENFEKPAEKIVENIKKEINYEEEVLKLLHIFIFKVPEYKYNQQNFFLNFGNVGITSSPQVMINNNCQLVDYIKKTVICADAKELSEYLNNIFNDNKTPTIDTSKMVQQGFDKFYLNNLRKLFK